MELKLKGDYFVTMFTKENEKNEHTLPGVKRSEEKRADEQEIKTARD